VESTHPDVLPEQHEADREEEIPLCRKMVVEDKGLREAGRARETLVLHNLRFHKLHSKRPEITILVFSAGRNGHPSDLRIVTRADFAAPSQVPPPLAPPPDKGLRNQKL